MSDDPVHPRDGHDHAITSTSARDTSFRPSMAIADRGPVPGIRCRTPGHAAVPICDSHSDGAPGKTGSHSPAPPVLSKCHDDQHRRRDRRPRNRTTRNRRPSHRPAHEPGEASRVGTRPPREGRNRAGWRTPAVHHRLTSPADAVRQAGAAVRHRIGSNRGHRHRLWPGVPADHPAHHRWADRATPSGGPVAARHRAHRARHRRGRAVLRPPDPDGPAGDAGRGQHARRPVCQAATTACRLP